MLTSLKQPRRLALVGLATGILTSGLLATWSPGAHAEESKWAADAASRAANTNGESDPRDIEWVRSTRGEANQLLYGVDIGDDAGRRVEVVQVRGEFTAKFAHGPKGRKPPQGTYITLVLDAESGAVTDSGLSLERKALEKLGDVHREGN